MREYVLYNDIVPGNWEEGLPVGNGRLGAVLGCGISRETLYLSEETIWSSKEQPGPNPAMKEKIAEVRKLFLDDKPAEAEKLANKIMGDCFTRICSYEYAGLLNISLHENDHCKNYRNELDLMRGIASVSYDRFGSHYTRECFSSYPDNVIAYRVTSSKDTLNAWISFDREYTEERSSQNGELIAVAHTVRGNHKFCVKARVVSDGQVSCEDGDIFVSGAKSFCVYINIATQFKHSEDFVVAAKLPEEKEYAVLRKRHEDDFLSLMSRAEINLPELSEVENSPVRFRRSAIGINGYPDQGIAALVWQFGRYMLASSSRPGSLPSNLQGLWAGDMIAPWSSDYHFNINLQMNYWPAETANLSECHLPLFDYMNNYLLESGKETAKIAYGTNGCVAHHLSDIYGFTSVADGLWGLWPHGASWLCFHMWEHYLFTKDKNFLCNTAYEFIKQSAIFFLENMMEDKKGQLVYAPSSSPENRYFVEDENGEKYRCFLAMSSTMDVAIIGGLFRILIDSAEILGISDDCIEKIKSAKEKLPPFRVGKFGQLMEWIEDYEETEVGHRHMSQTFGFYPDNAITRATPELYKAVSTTIDRKFSAAPEPGSMGIGSVGLSYGWVICILARLRRGNAARGKVLEFIQRSMRHNLFGLCMSGAGKVFQIDGNFGVCAGITEMLIQSHEELISLLPALPDEWSYGSFCGLRARGGYTVDVKWEDMQIYDIFIRADFNGEEITIELPETQRNMTFVDNNGKVYTAMDNKITLNTGKEIHLIAKR